MVAMASDSYLLKAPAAPAQAQGEARCRCRRCCDRRGEPACGGEVAMAVTLVVLAAGLLSLAGIVFYLNVQLTQVRAKVAAQEHQLGVVNTKLTNLNLIEQFKAFEAVPPVEMDDFDEPGDELLDDDDTQPVYPDWENSNIETRVQPDRSAHSVQPLQPAGSLRDEDPAAAPVDEEEEDDEDDSASSQSHSEDAEGAEMREEPPVKFPEDSETRVRRDVRPQAQLRLYHTLQSPGPGPAVPGAETWSAYGSRQAQPMYAERPPTGFVAPPRPARTNSYHATTPGTPIASRRSRVMNAAAAAPRPQQAQHHRTGRRQRLQELQQQAPLQEVPQDVSRQDVEVGRRRQPWAHFGSGPWRAGEYEQRERDPRRWRGVRSIDTTVEVEQTWRPYTPVVEGPAIAAHFVADSTRHRGTHHYDDNGRLKHPTGEYVDWRASDWVRELGLDQHFRLAEAGGHVTVDTPGLYLVYAQVNYANDRDENGFWVYRNARKELLCAVTAAVSSASAHANTCFTAGVLLLARGDRVSLRDLAGDRYRVLDHPGRSFIGLVNLSSCKLKQEPQASRMAVAA